MHCGIVKSGPRPHSKLAAWISDAFVDEIIVESEVVVDAEVEVGAEVEAGADFPFVHHADGRSDPFAYIIYTMCKSCYLVDNVFAELDTLPSIIYSC